VSALPNRILRLLASDGQPRGDGDLCVAFPSYMLRSVYGAIARLITHRLAIRDGESRVVVTELGKQIAANPTPPRWHAPRPRCGRPSATTTI